MCRMLLINGNHPRSHDQRLRQFAVMCHRSEEYQGHGWGACWWDGETWREHHSPTAIWNEPDLSLPATNRLLVHARSAFRDRDIALENNMPFVAGDGGFAFNGELRGVRLNVPGRTGARRIHHLLGRRGQAATVETSERVRALLSRRSRHIPGLNWIVAGHRGAVVSTLADARLDYYTMHRLQAGTETLVCSAPLDRNHRWQPLDSGVREEIWWSS